MSPHSNVVVSLLLLASWATIYLFHSTGLLPSFGTLKLDNAHDISSAPIDFHVDGLWNSPTSTLIDDLSTVINGSGVYGFLFDNSYAPAGNSYYGGYNYCDMPHVNSRDYVKPSEIYTLEYVEVVCPLVTA